MKIHAPFTIGPRLLPALRVADATIELHCIESTFDARRYAMPVFFIGLDSGERYTVDDLRGPAAYNGSFESMPEIFATLLSFMDACGESVRYSGLTGENADLFESDLAQWCGEHAAELSMRRWDLLTEESQANGSDEVNHALIEA